MVVPGEGLVRYRDPLQALADAGAASLWLK
jgi:hypothetical protein